MREKEVHHEEKPSKLANIYKRILAWALNHKIITSSIAVLLLVGSLALVPIIGVSFYHLKKKNDHCNVQP